MSADSTDYHRQIEAQIAQYADIGDMHEGSPAAHWMREQFLAGRLREVFGVDNVIGIYATYLAEAARRCDIAEIVSLGSGYGTLEIEIMKWARDHRLAPFRIRCLELSPGLVDRTRDAVRMAGLDQFVRVEIADLNQPMPVTQVVAAFMAHHSLHHLIELEALFDQVVGWLHPEGAFVTMDVIGRNGHMRWPETLAVIRQIWPLLPDRLKWDHMFGTLDRWYENWDCSIEGFEGIRAQDILPALIGGRFKFERFFATGGLTDVFYDRRFGGNFDLGNPLDVQFLEQIQSLEDRLIAAGRIKPVFLYAVMRSPRSRTSPPQPIVFQGMTPKNALRPVDQTDFGESPLLQNMGFTSPFPVPSPPAPPVIHRNNPVSFGRAGYGRSLTRWGWGDQEDDFIWSLGIESALEFAVAELAVECELRFIAYSPPSNRRNRLRIILNGVEQLRVHLSQVGSNGSLVRFREPLDAGATAILEFALDRPRRPDVDGGVDKRPIGIALISLTIR